MDARDWLEQTRTSYDTVAVSYAEILRGELAELPYERAVLAAFAERVGSGAAVADVGCGPGRVTAHLHSLGLHAFGIDLSPGMVDVARRDHPGLRFEVGSMTDLNLPDSSVDGVLAWYSLIHVPDDAVADVLAGFRRVLCPGGVVLLGFQVGEVARHKTSGYGGHPMSVWVHLRPVERVASWLVDAEFRVEAQIAVAAGDDSALPQGFVIAHRADGTNCG